MLSLEAAHGLHCRSESQCRPDGLVQSLCCQPRPGYTPQERRRRYTHLAIQTRQGPRQSSIERCHRLVGAGISTAQGPCSHPGLSTTNAASQAESYSPGARENSFVAGAWSCAWTSIPMTGVRPCSCRSRVSNLSTHQLLLTHEPLASWRKSSADARPKRSTASSSLSAVLPEPSLPPGGPKEVRFFDAAPAPASDGSRAFRLVEGSAAPRCSRAAGPRFLFLGY